MTGTAYGAISALWPPVQAQRSVSARVALN